MKVTVTAVAVQVRKAIPEATKILMATKAQEMTKGLMAGAVPVRRKK